MTVYVDTSVVLRVLLHEPNPVKLWGKWDIGFGSNLWRVEALRTVDRLRLSGNLTDNDVADLVGDIRAVDETLSIRYLDSAIMQRACESFPTVLGTLDALHLATAMAINEVQSLDSFLTHDVQLGTAARSVGFAVTGLN